MPSLFEVTAGKLTGPTTGGTVTQASNKSTTVVLNAESGQITMNGAALGAGSEVSFTVTNSKISSTDVVLVNHSSAGTAGAYMAQANLIADVSFKISVTNLTSSSESEAIVLSFVALKGASS